MAEVISNYLLNRSYDRKARISGKDRKTHQMAIHYYQIRSLLEIRSGKQVESRFLPDANTKEDVLSIITNNLIRNSLQPE